MKKVGLLSALVLVVTLSFAQVRELKETTVESPKFIGAQITVESEGQQVSPICSYLKNNLQEVRSFGEGVVVVLFTINSDGTVSNFDVVNSVSQQTDNAVISCLKSTSGLWMPGKVNGNMVEMEKEIYVHFVDPSTASLEVLAQQNIAFAVKKIEQAVQLKESVTLSAAKAEKKSLRKLNTALKSLRKANRYQPEEPSVVFWEACSYEHIGNEMR